MKPLSIPAKAGIQRDSLIRFTVMSLLLQKSDGLYRFSDSTGPHREIGSYYSRPLNSSLGRGVRALSLGHRYND